MKRAILIVDDSVEILKMFKRILNEKNLDCILADSASKGLEFFKLYKPKIVILDLVMPGMNGDELMEKMLQLDPTITVVICSGQGTIETAVDAIQNGAYDFITKPIRLLEFNLMIDRILNHQQMIQERNLLQNQLNQLFGIDNFIGKSPQTKHVFQQISQVCKTDSNVLITGESGTGKELVASALHYSGQRNVKPFIKINCASLPENMIESELFGHEKGAFTSAFTRRIGRFELANEGTLFLDEIGDMPIATQAKILRVLETKEFERVGGCQTIYSNVRLIAATNKNLEQLVSNNKFREDLYFRLNVININLPPLRERFGDIPLIASHYLNKYASQMNKQVNKISENALTILESYNWPGNVRELVNAVERAVVFCKKNVITEEDITPNISALNCVSTNENTSTLYSLSIAEKKLITKVLFETGWNLKKSAKLLDINRTTMYSKIEKLKINKNDVMQNYNLN
jgi:two-component system, NtrC family, response regulator AtoC